MKTVLLIIDPQIDFCDPARGSLYVPGAEADMARLAAMVGRHWFDKVHVTLDSHRLNHIAHPVFWKGRDGNPPAPFTLISPADLDAGVWQTANPEDADRARDYVRRLEEGGRYRLCIWPPHCLIGSENHAVMPVLFDALLAYERLGGSVAYHPKGANLFTEHYSALRADVPDLSDPSTLPDEKLLDALASAGTLFVAGEAGSHCVASTLRDLIALRGQDLAQRIVFVKDAVSPVTGFENLQAAMISDLTALGMRTGSTTDRWDHVSNSTS